MNIFLDINIINVLLIIILIFLCFLFRYKERILIIRDQIKDTPYDTVKHLAWWTEYVVRTKGAPHLRSTLALEPWYQRFDMDIVVFLAIVTCIIVSILFYIIIKLLVYLYKISQISTNKKQKIT